MDDQLQNRQFADSGADIDDLFDTIKELLDAAWGSDWGIFTDDEPTGTTPEDVRLPVITYDVAIRTPDEDIKSIKPRLAFTTKDPDSDGDNITVYKQWFKYIVRFDFWAKTNKECRQLARRFEDFMLAYVGHFKSCGISEILFQREGIDLVNTKWRQDIPTRSMHYLVRIERSTPVRSKLLHEVIEKVSLRQGNNPSAQ